MRQACNPNFHERFGKVPEGEIPKGFVIGMDNSMFQS